MTDASTATEVVDTANGPVEVARSGAGTPVLVVHGTPGGSDQAVAMGSFLVDAGYEVIAPSRPGYLGTPLATNLSIDDQADLHVALLDALGIDQVGVLAWSGGGPSAYRLAARHPHRVRALVVAAGVSQAFEFDDGGAADRFMMQSRAGNWLIRFLAHHAPKSAISSTLKEEGDISKAEVKALTEEAMADPGERALVIAMAEAAADYAHRSEGIQNDHVQFAAIDSLGLEGITAPTLLVNGSADTDVDPRFTDFAASTLPGAERIVLDRGTHLALWVHPEARAAQERVIAHLRP